MEEQALPAMVVKVYLPSKSDAEERSLPYQKCFLPPMVPSALAPCITDSIIREASSG